MIAGKTLKTICLILRQTPFQESSLVISALSPQGRLDFLIKGARSHGEKKFPVTGLFRELTIEYHHSDKKSLPTLKSMELTENFDALTSHTSNYLAACEFSAFLLTNCKPMLGAERTYLAFRHMLKQYCSSDQPEPWLTLAYLTFLEESGLLPEPEKESERILLEKLFDSAENAQPLPELQDEYWKSLILWVRNLLAHHGFKHGSLEIRNSRRYIEN